MALVSFHKILNLLCLSFIGEGATSIFLGFVYLLDLLQSVPRRWTLAFLLGDWAVFDHVVFLTTSRSMPLSLASELCTLLYFS